ncbi:MAG: hypothetical protein CL947_03430 [Epsilonproteobacteria bacterium]|nr:hypothetical protein [Campylobacterota bacterium]|tara:strand:- start:6456 stop:7034 length:579 start_codon:yes stop_codon:yes gene_type:complete
MKYAKSLLFLLQVLFLASCSSDIEKKALCITEESTNQTIIHGSTNLEHTSYINLIVNGSANFQHIQVEKQLQVNGSLQASDCIFKKVQVNGSFELEDSNVSELVQVNGLAEFQDCQLHKVELASAEVTFDDCQIYTIHIKKINNSSNDSQTVVLDDTVIQGNVTFESGTGKIVLEGSSKIVGKIIGGTIISK